MTHRHYDPNPDLTVGADNKQRWNQPAHRRHGFHNAHHLFRRTLMVRARHVLALRPDPIDLPARVPGLDALMADPAFSALCCVQGDRVVMDAAAPDFATTRPHSIQSVTKMHLHLIFARLLGQGLVAPDAPVSTYLPDIGSGYADAPVQALLDMAVSNDFSEDYADPHADCYVEEMALGWRLPPDGQPEPTLRAFAGAITGFVPGPTPVQAQYKSANTDVLTLIAAAVSPVPLASLIGEIADAAGYEGAFHISLSPEHLPAFSGGGCLSARDLARFGLLFGRGGRDKQGKPVADPDFLSHTLARAAPAMTPPRDWLRYSNHLMTDGRLLGHAGYGGQFLMVDHHTDTAVAFLSVLENDAGYDPDYMSRVAQTLRAICQALA